MTHEAVNERLPWYVNGTLAEDERGDVAVHLEACAVCREDLLLCEEMARAVRSDGAVPIPPATSAEGLLERAGTRARRRRLPDWRMAAAIAVVSVAAAMTYFQVNRDEAPNQRFTTTTGQSSVATVDYVFQLRFEASADDAARARIFENLGGSAQVVDSATQEYRVTLSLPPQSLTDLDARAAAIAAHDEVATADVVALQVPVR